MDQVIEWVQSNWGETGLLGTWAAIIARLIWRNARAWSGAVKRWFQSRGSTNTLGLVKHRDEDDDVLLVWKGLGLRINFHSSGKYTGFPPSAAQNPDQPTNDDNEEPTGKCP